MSKTAQSQYGKLRLSRRTIGTVAFLALVSAVASVIVIKILSDLALS
jgi:hypothetical protein